MNLFPSSRPNPRISRREGSSPSVRSGRLRPGRWRDPRLAGGAVLLGASVALGSWAVDSATRTEQIYVLAVDVAPGIDLSAEGVLTAVSSHPGTGAYVVVGDLPAGAVSTRSLKAGELLPAAAVSTAITGLGQARPAHRAQRADQSGTGHRRGPRARGRGSAVDTGRHQLSGHRPDPTVDARPSAR